MSELKPCECGVDYKELWNHLKFTLGLCSVKYKNVPIKDLIDGMMQKEAEAIEAWNRRCEE